MAAAVGIEPESDRAKRGQILEGARQCFLRLGFDGASMGEIARTAGVSKGTLYVYFPSKEALFEAIVAGQCGIQAEQVFALDDDDHDIAGVLTRLGTSLATKICDPGRIAALRTIIAIGERMPDAGQRFYESGPATGIARLATYLRAQVAAGVLAIDDPELAAAQFLDACLSTVLKPMLFAGAAAPAPERIAHVVATAVRAFLAAYRRS